MTTAQALLVVDVQRGWMAGPHAVRGAEALAEVLAATVAAARQAGALVVHLQDVGDADSTVPPQTPGRDLVLEPVEGEPVVPKTLDDGFAGTDLEDLLRGAGIRTLAIVGLQSEMCVAATARAALRHGYGVVWPRDASSTHDIPATGAAPAVPHDLVRRVAEWSLGDGLVAVDTAAEVRFVPVA